MSYYDYRWYTPQRPIKVKGGIKAQSKSGSFGKFWWAKRWITVLESFRIGARLGRGRSYARGGQVMDIYIESGLVTAKVQGSRASPYKVSIALKPLSDKEWDKVIKLMANKAIYSAKLLAGEMPQDIEEVFNSAKVPMFPGRLNEGLMIWRPNAVVPIFQTHASILQRFIILSGKNLIATHF